MSFPRNETKFFPGSLKRDSGAFSEAWRRVTEAEKKGPPSTYVVGGHLQSGTFGTPSTGLSLGRVARPQSPPLFGPAGEG